MTGIGTFLIGVAAILAVIFNVLFPSKTQVELKLTSADIDKFVQSGKPEEASRIKESARKIEIDPNASFVDKAIAEAYRLQLEERTDDAIEKWHSIANVVEGIDNDLAARAWFSIGYLYSDGGEEEKSLSSYNKAIDLKPDYAEIYTIEVL